MRLFDSHCHILDARFADDVDVVLERARKYGVERFACCSVIESDWVSMLALAQPDNGVLASLGLHPWFTEGLITGWEERLIKSLEIHVEAGVGEIGLDHALDESTHEQQRNVFISQIEIARELQRPMSIHCRRAWGAMLDTLGGFGKFPAGFVVHSYSGSAELVGDLVQLGGYFSFSGSITRSGNKRGQKSVVAVPADRLLVETDAPDMMPVFRGELEGMVGMLKENRNEPMTLPVTLKAVADLRGLSVEDIARITFENGKQLFGA